MTKETFAAARTRLFNEFKANGYETSKPDLKQPWVKIPTSHRDGVKLSFHAQALYLGAHSLYVDMRGATLEQVMQVVRGRLGRVGL